MPLYYAQVEPITPTVDRPTGNDSPSILLDDGDMQYSYIVKVLDGDGKKGYKVHKLRTSKHFTSCMEIKDQLQESLKEHLSCDKFDVGYIEAGRQGIRGKTRWIFSSEDIDDMYESYKSAGKTEIPRRGKASYMTVYLASDLSHQVSNDSKFKVHLNDKNLHMRTRVPSHVG